jgi:type VI secretion system secreted protein VgrG
VEYLEGDPDHPVITGRVYNNDHMPPYALPGEKTKSVIKTNSSKGGEGTNEIRFEDLKGSEQLLIHAQKDYHLRVTNDRVENVEHDRHLTVDNDKRELVKRNSGVKVQGTFAEQVDGDHSTKIGGKKSEKVAGTLSITCDGDVVEKYGANHKHEVTTTYLAKAQSIKLEAASTIELKVGGNHLIISTSGIELKQGGASVGLSGNTVFVKGAPQVLINTAPAPPGMPVGPVTASATAPEAPEAPIDADDVRPGSDRNYQTQPYEVEQLEPLTGKFEPVKPPEQEEVELTWIEIELVDESDRPMPGERYELKLPNGKIRKGTLDANGVARVENIPPGACEVCFPNLDAEAWEEI